jgi:hypothetical protein
MNPKRILRNIDRARKALPNVIREAEHHVATAETVLGAGQSLVSAAREAVERAKSALGMAPPALLNPPKKSSRA